LGKLWGFAPEILGVLIDYIRVRYESEKVKKGLWGVPHYLIYTKIHIHKHNMGIYTILYLYIIIAEIPIYPLTY
jgi:hypothetical protein